MKFVSSRGGAPVGLDEALLNGIAEDGGLFLPARLPSFGVDDFDGAEEPAHIGQRLLEPFFADSALAGKLESIVAETFRFPIPCRAVGDRRWLLELFHGPTAAFKDVGAGFLAACLSRLQGPADDPLVILVATSGDTGGAVAAAFDGRPEARVAVLFPRGRVSGRQARQLCCWSDNVLSLEVDGSFDDCQGLVKAAFADPGLNRRYRLSSANSINIGRLLPQSCYYATASLQHLRRYDRPANFIVPTGNLGNALACVLARDMGLPIGDIVLATNANRLIPDYLAGSSWQPRTSLQTLASAMDVGNPSNMERLFALHGERNALQDTVRAASVSDEEIEAQIRTVYAAWHFAICPHTATAFQVYDGLDEAERAQDWILVATAHAAKFETVVEPLIGTTVELPPALAEILHRPVRSVPIAPDLRSLQHELHQAFGGTLGAASR